MDNMYYHDMEVHTTQSSSSSMDSNHGNSGRPKKGGLDIMHTFTRLSRITENLLMHGIIVSNVHFIIKAGSAYLLTETAAKARAVAF